MKPRKVRVPSPVLHRPSGQDVVFLRQPDKSRRMVYLGQHGTPEAASRYREVLAAYLDGRAVEPARDAQRPSPWPSVGQLVAAYLLHAQRFYVDQGGKVSRTLANTRVAVAPLVEIHRDIPTDRYGLRELGAVRQLLVDGEFGHQHDKDTGAPIPGTGRRRCRNYINQCLCRIKAAFRWGVETRMVPGSTWHELSAFRGLPIGRAGVRETVPVVEVPKAAVDAILPHLPPILQSAVMLQWWSGMRPAELLQLTTGAIRRDGERWHYLPKQHKGAWRGKERLVAFGPEARAILRPLLRADPKKAIFSPVLAMRERKARWRADRASKVPPSQQERDQVNAEKSPPVGEFYDVGSYRRAINRACKDAGVEPWSPNRLRHAAGTRVAIAEGVEQAGAMLGHADTRVTRRYVKAARDLQAIEVAERHG